MNDHLHQRADGTIWRRCQRHPSGQWVYRAGAAVEVCDLHGSVVVEFARRSR